MVVESEAMRAVLTRVGAIAEAAAPVVIHGETGSGKEVVARVIHTNSDRRDRPFVAVNTAALPAELLESELFGHVKGAFTGAIAAKRGLFEEADGGTLFLDEIAEMPLSLQAKLLRVLQSGEVRPVGGTRVFEVDTRIVCATHRNLRDEVARGRFREDLYFRLAVFTIQLPPLRERAEDVLPIARSILGARGRRAGALRPEAERALAAYLWPGNVRELLNAIEHAVALSRGGDIELAHLPDDVVRAASRREEPRALPALRSLPTLAEIEREHVLRVLDACGGNQHHAARVLGIGRNTLWRKLRGYALAERVSGDA
jgi:two-component system response regulator HydG